LDRRVTKPEAASVKKYMSVLALIIIPMVSQACCNKAAAPDPSRGPAVVIKNGAGDEWTVWVELARTPEEQRKGLMWRWSLEKDHGMLFIYEDAGERHFWMKNTRIPLDMIFIGPDKKIAGMVENAEPYTEESRSVAGASQWVLEVSGGECAAHNIAPGDRVYFFDIKE
jgi:uncharacterized membrane protein (UPF0127 family)